MVSAPKRTIHNARRLRRALSLPEAMLWRILRERPGGHKFRRQHPIGPYALDFYCLEQRTAFEIDGISHEMGDRPERDAARDAWLTAHRIRVVRISASDVLRDVDAIAQLIVDLLRS